VRDVLGEKLYAREGRPSIPPEQLLSALLLQVFYGIRSKRQLMEQLDYNLLYRWFVDFRPTTRCGIPTVFTRNRDRLQNGEVFAKFMAKLLNHPQVKPLLPGRAFLRRWDADRGLGLTEEFPPQGGSGDDDGGADFHGQKRKNDTHASTTDLDCRLYRKAAAREAKLCSMGHSTMENQHGLAVVVAHQADETHFPKGFSFSSRAVASLATFRSNSCSRGTFFSTKLKYFPLQKSCICMIESTSGMPSSLM
jgi:hypothetical protein